MKYHIVLSMSRPSRLRRCKGINVYAALTWPLRCEGVQLSRCKTAYAIYNGTYGARI